MKRLLILFIIIALGMIGEIGLFSQQTQEEFPVKFHFDKRVELMGLVFRLAGCNEYNNCKVNSYNEYINSYFQKFKDHEIFKIIQQLRKNQGVGFDAPMNLAVNMTDDFQFSSIGRPFYLDKRWTEPEINDFMEALREFVKDVDYNTFLEKNNALYSYTSQHLANIVKKYAHLEWFPAFFGPGNEKQFHIVPGILNGGNCYGVRSRKKGNTDDIYCILGVWLVDPDGLPLFNESVIETVIHEFCHSYVNPLVDKYEADLKKNGEKLFQSASQAMIDQHYGDWKTMMYETILRACVVRYVKTYYNEETAQKLIDDDKSRNFTLSGPLSILLEEYENQRKDFPTLDSFFPKIIAFFTKNSTMIPGPDHSPKVVTMIPENGSTDVDPGLQSIIIHFDHAMKDKSWSIMGEGLYVPEFNGEPFYRPGNKILVVPVKLKPGWKYDFWLNFDKYKGFISQDGDALVPYHVQFTVKNAN